MWSVTLNGTDITDKVIQVTAAFAAENVSGSCTIELADRAVLDGIVVPRVPREKLISVNKGDGSPALEFYLESIEYPQDLNSKTASIWGRTNSSGLYMPRAQKISKQWPVATTINAIAQELADLCGVTVTVQNDYPVCAYCYAVSDQYPSEILQDLATKSGQILWPQPDGSLAIAPRLYRALPEPVVVLTDPSALVESVTREVPDFGNRILVSGDGAVAGLSVQVVPLVDDTECVAADGQSSVRLIAIVLGADGLPVALGTVVTWSASAGLMSAATSETQEVVRQGEAQRAQSYTQLTLGLPALSVIGVYARRDVNRRRNLYSERGGSVSGRVVTFSRPLDYYDQAVFIDYIVQGAPNTWIAGRIPGDVSVLASVAGAQGFCTLHQSNPTACATQITMESSPSSPCLGDTVSILLKTTMFGGAGVGAATFGIQGCGSLSSTRKILTPRTITETLRTSVWGGAAEVRLSAIPVSGTTPSVVLTETPGGNLYASHNGQVLILNDSTILPGTQVTVTYVAGGTALVGWTPTALPSGNESIVEWLKVVHAEVESVTVAQVILTRTPVAAPTCVPLMEISNFYASHDGKTVTLLQDGGTILPVDTQVQCTYQSVWLSQPGCSAIITARVDDGSEDGGRAQISVSARDCRTINPSGPGGTYDPEDPDQIPDETPGEGEQDEHDPTEWLEPEEPVVSPTGCNAESINARTPTITSDNHSEVFVGECPGTCTCDELCASLRSTGRLSTEGGMTYAMCMDACAQARDDKCTPCTLTGPTVLNPGQEGTWDDGKSNSAEISGGSGLTFVSRSFEDGYTLRIPTGGAGPFTIRVCYGETEESCCEAQVDFPPCSLSGPSSLAQGQEGEFVPSLGMTGAGATPTNMEIVRTTDKAIIAKLAANACEGSLEVFYGGRKCGKKTVEDSYGESVGVVAGPDSLDPGDSAYFAHSLGSGATYTGSMEMVSSSAGGAILRMPQDAAGSETASWTGRCGVVATKSVLAYDDCWADGEGVNVGMYLPVVNSVGWHPYYQVASFQGSYGYGGQPAGCRYGASAVIGKLSYYTEWECVFPPTHREKWNLTSIAENPCE